MGTLLDTTVFIDLERAVRLLPPEGATAEVSGRLDEQPRPDEETGIAAITAAGLLHGVHRAAPEGRDRREAFIKAALEAFPPLPSGLLAARAHARIWAGLAAAGHDVGAPDRLIAATAITARWRAGTANLRYFDRIVGLDILTITFTG